MPDYTVPHGIQYPLSDDPIKDLNVPAKLADDIKALAGTANLALSVEGARAEAAAKYPRAVLTSADNLDSVTKSGFYPISGNAAPAGLPPGVGAAGVWVGDLLNSTGNIQVQLVLGYNPTQLIFRSRSTAGTWLPWKLTAIDDAAKIDGGAGRRATLVDAAIKRRGGIIGTNGLAAVALRFDHHLPEFQSKVLPLLKSLRLPWGQMLNSVSIANGSAGMTYAQIAAACYTSGGEVWNHSYSHLDFTSEPQADREVTQGLSDLRAGLPQLQIDGWAAPGQSSMMGMEGSDTPEKFWGTYPGRLILAQHPFVRGYYPGIYQPMTGPNLVGAPHSTMDTLDESYVSGIVRGAIAAGSGLTLMLHPNYLDTAGYMTTAQLTTILTDIATMRDNGELLVLSPAAILLTDASSGYRRNLLATGAAGTTNGTWTETASSRSAPTQYGVPHELVVTVKARVAGTVTLALQESATTKRFDQSHMVTLAAGAFTTLRCLATFPLDTAGVTASLTGNVDRSDIQLHAV